MAKSKQASLESKEKPIHSNEKKKNNKYYFGGLKKVSLDSLEVYGTLCTSVSADKEINSLDLVI